MNVLNHLVNITTYRDQERLDAAVLTAVLDIVEGASAQVFEFISTAGKHFIRFRAMADQRGVRMVQRPEDDIENFPDLGSCVNSANKPYIISQDCDGKYVLWMPIWFKDAVIAGLRVTKDAEFSEVALGVLQGVLAVYKNYLLLIDYSERDSLTGLLNRKTFDEQLSKMQTPSPFALPEVNLGDRRKVSDRGACNWLAIFDIDHFKRVNDKFGHLYGDEVLILVANFMRTSFRFKDRLFRFGGEEFIVLLDSCNEEDAERVLNRFRTSIEKHEFPQVGQITISIGYTKIVQEDSPVVVLGHADEALYYAKEHGRNQVCQYERLVADGVLQVKQSDNSCEFF